LGGLTSSIFMDRDLGGFAEPHSSRETSVSYIRCDLQCQ
jgi:hypothetical protein